MSLNAALLIGMGAVLCAACVYIRVLRARGRTLARAVADHERRESVRIAFCASIDHDLDETCMCRRCLDVAHAYREIETRRTFIVSRLVNPNADPGALHLDSNFQPDYDYGLTESVYRCDALQRCERCGHERTLTSEEAVEDERH